MQLYLKVPRNKVRFSDLFMTFKRTLKANNFALDRLLQGSNAEHYLETGNKLQSCHRQRKMLMYTANKISLILAQTSCTTLGKSFKWLSCKSQCKTPTDFQIAVKTFVEN